MKPLGEVQLDVSKGQKQYSLKFQVVEGNARPLLLAETCQNLGLLTITIDGHVSENVYTVQDTQSPLMTKNEILHKYKDVFEGLGNIGKAKLAVDPEVKPVQHAPRRVAATLHQTSGT